MLTSFSEKHIKERCIGVAKFYENYLDGLELFSEVTNRRMLLRSRNDILIFTPRNLLRFVVQYGDERVFSNLRVKLQILLTIAVSVASCERPFNKLMLMLSYLRAAVGQERLSALTIINVEHVTNKVNFDDFRQICRSESQKHIHVNHGFVTDVNCEMYISK